MRHRHHPPLQTFPLTHITTMARTFTSSDGRPRVILSASVSATTHDRLMHYLARLKKKEPTAKMGQAVDSLADFAKVRRFDPIRVAKLKPASTPAPAKPLPAAKA